MPNMIAVSRPIELRPHAVVIDAPRELVFQMLTAFRRGRVAGDNTESTRLVSEDGDTKIVEFHTKAGPFTYKTVEEVTLSKPDSIAFRHLEGPLHFSEEKFTLEETPDGCTLLTHSGSFIWSRFPFFGWFGGMIYTRPMFHRVIKRHLAAVKKAAEARAARSHVFRRRETTRA